MADPEIHNVKRKRETRRPRASEKALWEIILQQDRE